MIKNQLEKVIDSKNLTNEEMEEVMEAIMSGEVSEIEISSFLTALKIKGETVDEISAAAKVMRNKAQKVNLDGHYTIDTCGTGGDCAGTYNISTAVAFVAAAGGVKVVKHGNRSVSSKSGSADVLEKLGININLSPDKTKECVEKVGIGFFFAPLYHSAMKHVMGVRRTLGVRTIFNILGPLANPASANGQVLGVFDKSLVEPLAKVLNNLGVERALVVHGEDGLDEITVTGKTFVSEVKDGGVTSYEISPEDFGFNLSSAEDIKGKDAEDNAEITKALLSGKLKGAKLDILLLNSGAAFYVAKAAGSIAEGVEKAKAIIESGKGLDVINKMAEFTRAA